MTLHHLVEGDGPAVVFVHAGVADLRMWDQPTAALVAAGHLPTLERPGEGGRALLGALG